MKLLRCPLCGDALTRQAGACRCTTGHSFDLAREGYVNLLPVQDKHSKAPGDDKTMSAARRAFLDRGYYAPLRQALAELAVARTGDRPTLLDAGCGEGYYTSGVVQALAAAGKQPLAAGIDISKFILKAAARRESGVEFAVASSYRLPLAAEQVDLLLNCFSPLALEEFRRVLRPGGVFLYVVPGAQHLWEMKEILYENPYPNEEKETPYPGFRYETVVPVDAVAHLDRREDVQNLFAMTPYAWKTPQAGRERLAALTELVVQIAFRIHVFTKE